MIMGNRNALIHDASRSENICHDIMHLPLKMCFFGDSTRGPRGFVTSLILCEFGIRGTRPTLSVYCVFDDSTRGPRGELEDEVN